MMKTQLDSIQQLCSGFTDERAQEFLTRAAEGALTRDENPQTHFCVYFAAYRPITREVFIGPHKKSGLWLFHGGHIDRGELPVDAVMREIGEEWGVTLPPDTIGQPRLLTITDIDNPARQTCTRHYDIWYFIALNDSQMTFDPVKLASEFYETRWLPLEDAMARVTDPATVEALEYLKARG